MSRSLQVTDPAALAALQVDAATLLDHALNGFFLADRKGRLLQCNQACLDILEVDEGEFLGAYMHDFAVHETPEEVRELLNQTARDGQLVHENQGRTGRGNIIDALVAVNFLPNEHGGFFFGYLIDITRRGQAERALLESRKEIEALARETSRIESKERRALGEMVHDGLAQDLAACSLQLSSVLNMLADEEDRAALGKAMDLLDSALTQSRTIIHDLAMPVLHHFGLDAALSDLCRGHQGKQGARFRFFSDGRPKPLDEGLLELAYRSVRELLLNAERHARASEILLSSTRNGNQMTLLVSDDGCGFDPAMLKRSMFASTASFGLFFISQRMRQIGGALDMEAREGGGARMRITMPLQTADAEDSSPPPGGQTT